LSPVIVARATLLALRDPFIEYTVTTLPEAGAVAKVKVVPETEKVLCA